MAAAWHVTETGEALDDRLMSEEDFKAASAGMLGSVGATNAGKKSSRLSRQKVRQLATSHSRIRFAGVSVGCNLNSRVPRQNSVQKMNNSWDDLSDDDSDAFWKKGGANADEADSGESERGGVMGRLGRRKDQKEQGSV